MGLMENALLSVVRYKLSRDLGMDSLIADIPGDVLREYTDIPYNNRAGKRLFMDILEPEVPAGTELPVIINIHGGGLIDGMFYTTRKDATGRFLARSFYGHDERSRRMAKYTNPEHPEIIHNIPPCYLIASKADMLERYTLDFAGELGNKSVEHQLRHMGSDPKLIHAFPVLLPEYPESAAVIDEIIEWFRAHE